MEVTAVPCGRPALRIHQCTGLAEVTLGSAVQTTGHRVLFLRASLAEVTPGASPQAVRGNTSYQRRIPTEDTFGKSVGTTGDYALYRFAGPVEVTVNSA